MGLLSVKRLSSLLVLCFSVSDAEPVSRAMAEECQLPAVGQDKDAARGLCTFQKTFHSSSVQSSLPLQDSEDAPKGIDTSPPHWQPSLSLLQSRTASAVGWTSILVLLCCCCLCGSAAGEWVLRKLVRSSVAMTKLTTALEKDSQESGQQDSQESGQQAETLSEGASSSDENVEPKSDETESATGDEGDNKDGPKLYEDYLANYWSIYGKNESPDVFEHDNLRIVKDGGMKDVPKLKVKYGKAVFTLLTGLVNCVLVVVVNMRALSRPNPGDPKMSYGDHNFLLTKWLVRILLNADELKNVQYILSYDEDRIVPLLELLFLLQTIVLSIVCVAGAALASKVFERRRAELQRWNLTSTFFWYCVPQLTSLSAMRLLHFVVPNILMSDAYVVALQSWEVISEDVSWSSGKLDVSFNSAKFRRYMHIVFSVVFFILSRFFALVLGFDAFLVKFRMASSSLDSGSSNMPCELAAVAFVWQVMGIIHLKWFVEKRLFIFMFAGKRGYMDLDEEALTDVWKALVAKKVYGSFSFLRATVVMLGFDTYDMQFLALDDDEDADATYSEKVEKRDQIARRQTSSALS